MDYLDRRHCAARSQGHDANDVRSHLRPGTIVTYLDLGNADRSPFRRAVATGDIITDPHTTLHWVPVVRPDCTFFLVEPKCVVDLTPLGECHE